MYNSAYTLMEMLLVLCMISLMMFTIDFNNRLKLLKLKAIIENIQIQALTSYKKMEIEINGNILLSSGKIYALQMNCEHRFFHINELGNISNALTIRCENGQLILQLGSGVVDVR